MKTLINLTFFVWPEYPYHVIWLTTCLRRNKLESPSSLTYLIMRRDLRKIHDATQCYLRKTHYAMQLFLIKWWDQNLKYTLGIFFFFLNTNFKI